MEEKINEIQEELKLLRKDVKELKEKGGDKKWFAIVMAIVTAVLASTSYLVEKNIDKSSARDQKSQETFGVTRANKQTAFLTSSKDKIVILDNAFEEYCLIGQDSLTQNKVINSAADFTSLLDKASVESEIKEDLKRYVDHVVDEVFSISNNPMDKARIRKSYEETHMVFEQAVKVLDARIKELLGE